MTDPVELTSALVRCPSVTPADEGALALLEAALTDAGFTCTRVDRGGVSNLFARWGPKGHPRTFGFNGHTDVVPPGEAALWSFDPFGGRVVDGTLQGRGATDMKSGVAAFVAAATAFVAEEAPDGAVILAITGDEEGDATDGTRALLDWMDANGERMDVCLVGEPTSREVLGDTIKIGRRGSMSAWFTVSGVQGHTAYPARARNAAAAAAQLVSRLVAHEIDRGSEHFDPTTLSVTTIDVGNPTTNVIPARATATVNIRFSDRQTSETITRWLEDEAAKVSAETGCEIEMRTRVSGESFLTPPGPLSELVASAVAAETGRTPEISTSGGTSDARFVRAHCPVVEFGLTGKTMHQIDECVPADEIVRLTAVYRRILADYFA